MPLHVWLCLCSPASQGQLGQLVQLIHSMSFLTGGLASIMTAFKPAQSFISLAHTASNALDYETLHNSQQQGAAPSAAGLDTSVAAEEGAELTVDILISCVLAAVEELPVWESTEVEQVGGQKLYSV